MAYIDENNITKRIRVMPHFIINDERQRINNCPQCGLHVRSLELNEEEYKQLTNESNNCVSVKIAVFDSLLKGQV
jgi:hypothetical protein